MRAAAVRVVDDQFFDGAAIIRQRFMDRSDIGEKGRDADGFAAQ